MEQSGKTKRSDAAGDVGKVEPDFYAAEVRAFGADGGSDAGAEMAGRSDEFGELGMDFAQLGDFVEGGLVDFFLGVEAGTHGPFVEEMKERAGFDQANGLGVGKEVERDFKRYAAIEKLVFGVPGVLHGTLINFVGARIILEQRGGDVVGLAGVGEGKQRSRAGDHAVALVLRVGGVADFLGEGVSGVLERA